MPSSLGPGVALALYCRRRHGLAQRQVVAPVDAQLLRAPTRCTVFAVSSTVSTGSSLAHLPQPGVLGCPGISSSRVWTKKWPGVGPGVFTCRMILVNKKDRAATELVGRGASSTSESPARSSHSHGPTLINEKAASTRCRRRPCRLLHLEIFVPLVVAGRLQEDTHLFVPERVRPMADATPSTTVPLSSTRSTTA